MFYRYKYLSYAKAGTDRSQPLIVQMPQPCSLLGGALWTKWLTFRDEYPSPINLPESDALTPVFQPWRVRRHKDYQWCTRISTINAIKWQNRIRFLSRVVRGVVMIAFVVNNWSFFYCHVVTCLGHLNWIVWLIIFRDKIYSPWFVVVFLLHLVINFVLSISVGTMNLKFPSNKWNSNVNARHAVGLLSYSGLPANG